MTLLGKYYRLVRYGHLVSDEEVLKRMPAIPCKGNGERFTVKELNQLFDVIKDRMIKEKLKDGD